MVVCVVLLVLDCWVVLEDVLYGLEIMSIQCPLVVECDCFLALYLML